METRFCLYPIPGFYYNKIMQIGNILRSNGQTIKKLLDSCHLLIEKVHILILKYSHSWQQNCFVINEGEEITRDTKIIKKLFEVIRLQKAKSNNCHICCPIHTLQIIGEKSSLVHQKQSLCHGNWKKYSSRNSETTRRTSDRISYFRILFADEVTGLTGLTATNMADSQDHLHSVVISTRMMEYSLIEIKEGVLLAERIRIIRCLVELEWFFK